MENSDTRACPCCNSPTAALFERADWEGCPSCGFALRPGGRGRTGVPQKRAAHLAVETALRFFGHDAANLVVADCTGAGLAGRLKDAGFARVVEHGPDASDDADDAACDVALAFGRFERETDPHALLNELANLAGERGLVLFSVAPRPPKDASDTWNRVPDEVRALHTPESLAALSAAAGLTLARPAPGIHLACRTVPDFARHLLRRPAQQPPPPDAPDPAPANMLTALARCRHGLFIHPVHDEFVGRSLALYGEFSPGESALFARLVPPGSLVVEAGANIGAHTVQLARLAGTRGAVVAFEPQRFLFQILCGNLALNGLTNVHARQAAAGSEHGTIRVPVPDYARQGNFGGLSLGGERGESVPVVPIDALDLPAPALIKADVEGMEARVVAGATKTIRRHRPVLFLENDRKAHSKALIELVASLEYRLYWHVTPLYDPNNFARNASNVFGNIVSINLLCLPKGSPHKVRGLPEVSGPNDWWR